MFIAIKLYTSQPYGRLVHPVGRRYASKAEADIGSGRVIYAEILLSVGYGSIIQVDKLAFDEEITYGKDMEGNV